MIALTDRADVPTVRRRPVSPKQSDLDWNLVTGVRKQIMYQISVIKLYSIGFRRRMVLNKILTTSEKVISMI